MARISKLRGVIDILPTDKGGTGFFMNTQTAPIKRKIALFDPQWVEYGGFAYPTQ